MDSGALKYRKPSLFKIGNIVEITFSEDSWSCSLGDSDSWSSDSASSGDSGSSSSCG